MENKEKLDQNPEEAVKAVQEENPVVSKETTKVSKEATTVKAKDAEGDKQEEEKEVLAKQETTKVSKKATTVKAKDAEGDKQEEEKEVLATQETTKVSEEVTNVKAKDAESDKQEEEKEVLATQETTKVSEEVTNVKAKDAESDKQEEEKEVLATQEPENTDEVKKEDIATSEKNPKEEEEEEEMSDQVHDDDDDEDDDEEVEVVTEETFSKHSMEELVHEMETIVESEKVIKAKNKISYIRLFFGKKITELKKEAKEKFLKDGGVEEEYKPEHNPLQEKFNHAFGKYKSLKAKYRKEQESLKFENLKKKDTLLEEMRELINTNEKLKDTYDKFNEIQTRWREIGMVPQADVQLQWDNYHFLVDKFFDKVKISKELRDLDLKKNLEAKLDLCEKAESLLIEESINKSFKKLQDYHNEWKAIGPVPTINNDEVWERFKSTSDKINERRKEHYEELQEKFEENYQAKLALCAKAEELFLKPIETTKEWNKRTEEFNELFKVWKTYGPAPRKHNDEVWDVFKGFMNNFFDAKKEHFSKLKEGQQDNYHRKLDLLKQAEALKDGIDWGDITKKLINLQGEWKKIGPVPRKYSDDIWKKFRAANDFFFSAKTKHNKGQYEAEEKNLESKNALIEEIKTTKFSKDKKENLEFIKTLQRRWSQIGNVPRKAMDKVYKDYRTAVDEQLDNLDISKVDFRNAGFRDHIDGLKKNDDDSSLRKERFSIQKSMDTIKEDVLLWENNMGFFRHSKNADVLKAEFEKKIKKAKAEIILLKEKIKLIDKR